MSLHIKAVTDVLKRRQVDSLPRGELFIHGGFLDRFFGEHKGEYAKQLEAAAQSLGLSLIGVDLDHEGTQPRSYHLDCKKLEEYFVVGYINGPIADLIENRGFFEAMLSMRKSPSLMSELTTRLLRDIERKVKMARANGIRAIAIADDIAGNQGLLFSFKDFMERVWPAYREIAEIIKENSLFAFFHSDGDMRQVIKALIEAGYDCLHPVDTQAGLNLHALRKEFGESISFMGHIDPITWSKEQIQKEVVLAESEFKKGGLILGSTCGISVETFNGKFGILYPRWEMWQDNGEQIGQ